ncbi:hypothetical protein PIB30_098323 [Stylosanthes scabra]|uniref:Uncharacterized protein n=1 Tax=Stylosanthes scabra TaxID=79078 RepID=A0ABU6XX97_9FABA|nr:hypothetical protein [Stylosanthes scabra]
MTPRRTKPTSTSSLARISSWLGSSYMARVPVQDPPCMHPRVDHQDTIFTDRRKRCTRCLRAHRGPPIMRFIGQGPRCSLILTQLSSVRCFSITSPPRSRTLCHHRISSIICHRPKPSRSTSPHRSRAISHLFRLSRITTPPYQHGTYLAHQEPECDEAVLASPFPAQPHYPRAQRP